jgi:hypothetical protein
MVAPIKTPLAGDIWHLTIDDLLAPLPEKTRLGGDGPFVINLSASTAPIDVPAGSIACCPHEHVYQIQRTEDRRPRYRLRLGPFASEDEAEAILEKVRDVYPSALTATADADDLRTIAAMQAKIEAPRAAASAAGATLPRRSHAAKAAKRPVTAAPTALTAAVPAAKAAPAVVAPPITAIPVIAPQVSTPPIAALPAGEPAAAHAHVATLSIPLLSTAIAVSLKTNVAKPKAATAAVVPSLTAPTAAVLKTVAPTAAVPTVAAPVVATVAAPTVAVPVAAVPATVVPAAVVPTATVPVLVVVPPRVEAKPPRDVVSAFTPPAVEQFSMSELGLETTQTVRALTAVELEDEDALRWFVVQLAQAEEAFDSESVPNLDIFSVYRLYCVAGMDQGRIVHTLRCGFFSEEIAAGAVASYLAEFYDNPTVKRVSAAERQRFADERFEPRKDVGATGKQAVIEITNERYIRERRTPTSAAMPESPARTFASPPPVSQRSR